MFNIWPKGNYRNRTTYKGTYFKQLMKSLKKDNRSENEKMFDELTKNGCLDCGNSEFLEGPSGGMAQNIKCSKCGSKYNVMPMGWAERI
jgi:predicted nucleic-acid-binding Zn-ribbon protein